MMPWTLAGLVLYALGFPAFYYTVFVVGRRNGFGFCEIERSFFTRKLIKCVAGESAPPVTVFDITIVLLIYFLY